MRYAVGLLLVVAALLKAIQLVSQPVIVLTSAFGACLLLIRIGVELGIGLLVLSGLYWSQLRWLAMVLFAVFAAHSLSLALAGAASCGCFGPIEVHPWWTFLLDVTMVLAIRVAIRSRIYPTSLYYAPTCIHRRTVVMMIVGVTVASIALLVRQAGSRNATASDLLVTAGNLVILEPEHWVGKPLPIADAIDLDLTHGNWTVLLHRHDCLNCQEALPRYEELAIQKPVALVELPPYEDQHASTTSQAYRTRLRNDRNWFVQTPVEIQLRDGIVLAVMYCHGN